MLKFVVLGCLVLASALAQMRTKDEIEEYRSLLYKTQEEHETPLEEAMSSNPKASAWENSGKYQGDILLTDEQIESLVQDYAGNSTEYMGRHGLTNTNNRWPDRTMIYEIAPNTFNRAQLDMIYWCMNSFRERTCTRWQRRTNQRDYILITGRNTGCYAHVGFWRGFGRHTLNLAPGCFNPFTIVFHEMLHSAGFWHMQQTYNRDNYVTVHWNSIPTSARLNFDIKSRNVVTNLGLPYELGSCMHYSPYAFTNNGHRTMSARNGRHSDMGHMRWVSGYDLWRLGRLYNCPGAWSVETYSADLNLSLDSEISKIMMKEAVDKELALQEKELNELK